MTRDVEATAPDGNIYFKPCSYCDDFSIEDTGRKSFFIHEMTHVWQHQHGMNMPMEYLRTLLKYKGRYSQAYALPVLEDCAFENSNLEQQAVGIQSFYSLREILLENQLKESEEVFQTFSAWIPPQFTAA
jgi:hypothetical protein